MRSALLRFAKWPFLTAAVFDLFRTRPRTYELTLKIPGGPGPRLGTIVHLATAGVVSAALAIGTARGNVTPSLLSVIALAVIVLSLTVTATAFRRFPPPYDRALAKTPQPPVAEKRVSQPPTPLERLLNQMAAEACG